MTNVFILLTDYTRAVGDIKDRAKRLISLHYKIASYDFRRQDLMSAAVSSEVASRIRYQSGRVDLPWVAVTKQKQYEAYLDQLSWIKRRSMPDKYTELSESALNAIENVLRIRGYADALENVYDKTSTQMADEYVASLSDEELEALFVAVKSGRGTIASVVQTEQGWIVAKVSPDAECIWASDDPYNAQGFRSIIAEAEGLVQVLAPFDPNAGSVISGAPFVLVSDRDKAWIANKTQICNRDLIDKHERELAELEALYGPVDFSTLLKHFPKSKINE